MKDFHFNSGEVLPELRLHYVTLGTPHRNSSGQIDNAVLLLHSTGSDTTEFFDPDFSGPLYGAGQPLDLAKFYLIIPDSIGHGKSSKPSNGLRARFPHYGYEDMVAAQHQLVTEKLSITHLRLVRSGYRSPHSQVCMPPIPARQYESYPTRAAADKWYDRTIELAGKHADANNTLYHYDASSDYNPAPDLEKIRAKLLLIVFADDQINSPEFTALDREMPRVKNGRFVIVPATKQSVGEGNNTVAELWRHYLAEVLSSSTQ